MSLFVDLAFPVEVNKVFTYAVPAELHDAVKPGARALAPFGKRTALGFIVNVAKTSHISNLKTLIDVLDDRPAISDDLFRLTKWISEYYVAPWGEVLKTALPPGLAKSGKRLVTATEKATLENASELGRRQAEVVGLLLKKGEMSIGQIQKQLRTEGIHSTVNRLAARGYVSVVEQAAKSTPKIKKEKVVEITDTSRALLLEWRKSPEAGSHRQGKQASAVEALLASPTGVIPVRQLLKKDSVSLSAIKSLEQKGVVHVSEREQRRLSEYDLYDAAIGQQVVTLTEHQKRALGSVREALRSNNFHTFLLHGVTGSGKTQVYIEAIRDVLASGKSAIVLVPEISLTPQIVRRFRFHFGDKVTLLHSRMSPGERYDSWRLTREGKYSIVIGPRSAVFAPVQNLGLIVVDEEQEASYKQFDQSPRYHARDVAIVRASAVNGVVILGSATPSAESYFNALQEKYKLLELPERVDNAKLPDIQIVDMTMERKRRIEQLREERKNEFKKDPVAARLQKRKSELESISNILKEKIEDRLAKNEGIILLQNRRGFAPFVECPDCGFVEMCDNCNVTLTYHLAKRQLRCHYCGFVKPPPGACPTCGGLDIQLRGIGTQRVEGELTKLFPRVSLMRMDLDTTTRKGSHDRILKKFAEGEYNILLGTQMVAKGLDFSRVTLVGVVSADTQMLLPDFRSAERVFQLLTQVAGRAGRSGSLRGEVVIQTSQPQHYSLKHVVTHDFREFYREELQYRQELDYPPFSRLVLIEFRGERENEVNRHAERFGKLLQPENSHFIVLGPAPAAIPRLKGRYRWHIVIKNLKSQDPGGKHLHSMLAKTLETYRNSALGKSNRVRLIVDVDPVGMM